MPVIRSAKKKLRVDKRREFTNKKFKLSIELAIKKAEKTPSQKTIQAAFKSLDKGVKKKILHSNKAARIKSRLSKFISVKTEKTSKTRKTKKIKK